MALDTVATPTRIEADTFYGQDLWTVTGVDSDASTAIDIKAAVTGKSHYITGVILTSDDDDVYPQLQDGDGTLLFGPFCSNANGVLQIAWKFDKPIKVTAAKSIALKAAAGGNVSVYIEGFTI
jgi:hypothetical protein